LSASSICIEVFQTAGEPPNKGRIFLANIGCEYPPGREPVTKLDDRKKIMGSCVELGLS
jgi:hypothetical protein